MTFDNIYSINTISDGCAVTVGMFDGVHMGHRHLLQLLKRESEARNLTPVVVTFDRHPRVALGKGEGLRLLMPYEEREQVLGELGFEGHVVVCEFTPEMAKLSACEFAEQYLVGKLNMKLLVLGYDNMFGNRQRDDFDRLPEVGIRCGFEMVNDTPLSLEGITVSSTKIRTAISEGNVALASRMLGQYYTLTGKVESGRKIGRSLGFPTANLNLGTELRLVPKEGVYAVKAMVEGNEFLGMVNVGGQPTFGLDHNTIEVNLFGDCGDLYGKEVRLSFLDRLRDIRRFDSPEALRQQLLADKQEVLNRFPTL